MSDQGGDTRIELMFRLEAVLKRIEQLEAALRENEAAKKALRSLYEWYERDGSVGGASDVFEDNRAALTPKREENSDVAPGFRGNNEA